MFEIEEVRSQTARIKVVGVGGAGGNAINTMIAANLHGVIYRCQHRYAGIGNLPGACESPIGGTSPEGLGQGQIPYQGRGRP
jgi:cell division protein FtsZ